MPADPKTYREMSQPFPSIEEANAALHAFFEELGELRKKHRLENVYVIVSGNYLADDGEAQFAVTNMYGNQLAAESLTAYAFGCEQAQRQEAIAQMLAKSPTIRKANKQD